jgi:hypothetical protein
VNPVPDELLEELTAGRVSLDDAVTQLADAGRDHALATLIGLRVALDSKSVAGVLAFPSEEPAAMLCRAAGLSVNGYSAVLRLRRRQQRAGIVAPSILLSAYRHLPKAAPPELAAFLQIAGCVGAHEATAERNVSGDPALA